ncbi:MAG: hypothetical protein ACO1N9_06630 [Flavobacterium sp.]
MKYLYLSLALVLSISASAQTKKLPAPSESVTNYSNVIGWGEGNKPIAPVGFTVTKYADGFDNPRWMYALPNGDILVAESNSNYGILKQAGLWLLALQKARK